MSERALGAIVPGWRHCTLSADDPLFIEGTMCAAGANGICREAGAGLADQVEAWPPRGGAPVLKGTANRMHETPATPEERSGRR
jgi:hypothetical protein